MSSTAGAAEGQTLPEQPASAHRYLALGDSYTCGEGMPAEQRYPVQLAQRLSALGWDCAPPLIIARTGWTTAELAAALHRAAPQGPYDLVTLLIGVNDQFRGLPLAAFQAGFDGLLQDAITLAGGRPQRVLVLSIPDWGVTPFAGGEDRAAIASQIDAFNALAAREAAQAGVRVVDITPLSRDLSPGGQLARDGLHPSGLMYARWVAAAAPVALGLVMLPGAAAH